MTDATQVAATVTNNSRAALCRSTAPRVGPFLPNSTIPTITADPMTAAVQYTTTFAIR